MSLKNKKLPVSDDLIWFHIAKGWVSVSKTGLFTR